jgi:hypothetical protein
MATWRRVRIDLVQPGDRRRTGQLALSLGAIRRSGA